MRPFRPETVIMSTALLWLLVGGAAYFNMRSEHKQQRDELFGPISIYEAAPFWGLIATSCQETTTDDDKAVLGRLARTLSDSPRPTLSEIEALIRAYQPRPNDIGYFSSLCSLRHAAHEQSHTETKGE